MDYESWMKMIVVLIFIFSYIIGYYIGYVVQTHRMKK